MGEPHALDIAQQDADFFRRLLDRLNDAIYFVDTNRRITYWNRGAAKLTGFSAEEAVGRRCQDDLLCHVNRAGERLCAGKCPLSETIEDGETREEFLFFRHKDGHRVPVRVRVSPVTDETGIIGAVEIFTDDSDRESAKHRASQLEELAFLDPLTGVANRRYLEIRLKSAFEEFALTMDPFGVLVIDIDEFKAVNDQGGHGAGDQALVMVARTLKGLLRPDDVLARWGGDEFVAIVNHANSKTLTVVAERCRTLVRETRLTHPSGLIRVTVSVGGVVADSTDTPESLLQKTDRMMYLSKTKGRDWVTIQDFAVKEVPQVSLESVLAIKE